MLFFNRSYTGVSTGDTIIAVLVWIHCNLGRLNFEGLMKSDLQ